MDGHDTAPFFQVPKWKRLELNVASQEDGMKLKKKKKCDNYSSSILKHVSILTDQESNE